MTIDELKRLLVEVKETCDTCSNCADCLFGVRMSFGLYTCVFNPIMCTGAFPTNWKIDDWKEDSNATD